MEFWLMLQLYQLTVPRLTPSVKVEYYIVPVLAFHQVYPGNETWFLLTCKLQTEAPLLPAYVALLNRHTPLEEINCT